MRRFRFSLLALFGLVTLAAINFAALRYAPELWASAALTLAIAMLLIAVLGAWLRRGAARAFWAGFAFISGAYLTLVFGPWFEMHLGHQLVTTKLIQYVYSTGEAKWSKELAIRQALEQPAQMDFDTVAFSTVIQFLQSQYGINIELHRSIQQQLGTDFPITYAAQGITLRAALDNMLSRIGATYWIANESLVIGMPDAAPRRGIGRFLFPVAPSPEVVQRGGHSLFAMLFGLLGALAARHFYDANKDSP